MSYNESDRVSFNKHQQWLANTEQRLADDQATNDWLDKYPEIGTLNGINNFYVMINGVQKKLARLQIP